MKKILIHLAAAFSLAAAATVAAPAWAQADPAATAAAQELFDSMNYRVMMTGMMQQMSQNVGISMRSGAEAAINANTRATPEEKKKALAKMEAELPGVIGSMQKVMSDPGLVDDILAETIPLYARTFSADELKQITAFYRTPVGAKMLAAMPKLTAEGMQLGQQIVMRRIGPMIQQLQQQQEQRQQQQQGKKP